MTGMYRLQLFQLIITAFGIGVMLIQCISLIRELRQYSGYSIRTGRHNLYRVYQIVLKPLGLTLTFVAVYFGLKLLYLQTYDASEVVMYDVWPSEYFTMSSICICFQLYALLERVILKRKLKTEYLDYVFWDVEVKSKNDRPLMFNESKREQFPLVRGVHYARIFMSIVLGVMFIASGIESMDFFRAICADQIYEARDDQPDRTLRYRDIVSIEQDEDDSDYYVVRGNAGQEICMNDDSILQYVAQQSGIKIPRSN